MTDALSFVEIYRCPVHQGMWSVLINDTRVFGSKCCPKQYSDRQVAWPLTREKRDGVVEEMDAALKGR